VRVLLFWLLIVPAVTAGDRLTVVVWPFEDITFVSDPTGGPQDLGSLAMETMIAGLMRYERVEVVERERLDRILEELNLSCSGLADQEACLQVGKIVGAGKMVFGEYFLMPGGQVHFLVRLVDVETSLIDASLETVVPSGRVFGALERLGRDLGRMMVENKGPAGEAGP